MQEKGSLNSINLEYFPLLAQNYSLISKFTNCLEICDTNDYFKFVVIVYEYTSI